MKYPENLKNIIDVTKAPYYADNTGKTDCTKALIQAVEDGIKEYIAEIKKTEEKLYLLSNGTKENCYLGREIGRVLNGEMTITWAEKNPPRKIIYFPEGEYLISDTITYSSLDLHSRQQIGYMCELCRNIHIHGESKEKTIIRLADGSKGFEQGTMKPVISFLKPEKLYDKDAHVTDVAQMNTLKDITIDCGDQNPGAVGVYYVSSNLGRIENVNIIAKEGYCGIEFGAGTEGCFDGITVAGFDYGFDTRYTSPCVMTNVNVRNNKIAGFLCSDSAIIMRSVDSGEIPTVKFREGKVGSGRIFIGDKRVTTDGEFYNNRVYYEPENTGLTYKEFPKINKSTDFSDWVCVDDFGAVGDGVTDCSKAIQDAMNSGKSVVYFGEGTYLINKFIKVPKTVRAIDFMYCDLCCGIEIMTGEFDCVFDVCEDGDLLSFENMETHEELRGHMRFIKHSAKRDIILYDIATIHCAMYFNTVPGSTVYIDNAFLTTSSYAQNCLLSREDYIPVFCRMLPFEFHGQTVYAKNMNPERGNIELLNDNSTLFIDGYKTEGPGMGIKAVNGGVTKINLANHALWINKEDYALYEIYHSDFEVSASLVLRYSVENPDAFTYTQNGAVKTVKLNDCSRVVKPDYRMIDHYCIKRD